MALIFERATIHDHGVAITATGGTPDNFSVGTSLLGFAPNNMTDFMLEFYKVSNFIVDVGVFVKWQTPGALCTSVKFDFPISEVDLIPNIKTRTYGIVPFTALPNTFNVPVSPIREASFFINERDPIEGHSWLRYENGKLQFYMQTDSPLSMMKVTSEFRYQLNIQPIHLI